MFSSGISFHAAVASRHLQLKLYSDFLNRKNIPKKKRKWKSRNWCTAMQRFLFNHHTNSIDQFYGADP